MNINAVTLASDDNLAQRVEKSIQRLGWSRCDKVTCVTRGTTVVLHGETRTYYHKQLAQTIAGKVPGVHCVINHVEVVEPQQTT